MKQGIWASRLWGRLAWGRVTTVGFLGLTTTTEKSGRWGRLLRLMCLFGKHEYSLLGADFKGTYLKPDGIVRKVYHCVRCGETVDVWEVQR